MISPIFEAESKKEDFKDVGFYKIDIDVLTQELATEFAISALPTFLSIKNQKTIRTSVGANLPALKELIKAAQAAA
ncbi:hypothetical protein C0991_007824 [Blastosporella zonata]|nr:hypothetical protein C0991_007824 [Blastosporella zonata]